METVYLETSFISYLVAMPILCTPEELMGG